MCWRHHRKNLSKWNMINSGKKFTLWYYLLTECTEWTLPSSSTDTCIGIDAINTISSIETRLRVTFIDIWNHIKNHGTFYKNHLSINQSINRLNMSIYQSFTKWLICTLINQTIFKMPKIWQYFSKYYMVIKIANQLIPNLFVLILDLFPNLVIKSWYFVLSSAFYICTKKFHIPSSDYTMTYWYHSWIQSIQVHSYMCSHWFHLYNCHHSDMEHFGIHQYLIIDQNINKKVSVENNITRCLCKWYDLWIKCLHQVLKLKHNFQQ